MASQISLLAYLIKKCGEFNKNFVTEALIEELEHRIDLVILNGDNPDNTPNLEAGIEVESGVVIQNNSNRNALRYLNENYSIPVYQFGSDYKKSFLIWCIVDGKEYLMNRLRVKIILSSSLFKPFPIDLNDVLLGDRIYL